MLFTWFIVYVATNSKKKKKKDDLKTALMNTDDQWTDPPLPPDTLQFQTIFFPTIIHLTSIELIPLELIHSSRDALRKAREAYLIERGQTLEPKGINEKKFNLMFYPLVPYVLCYIYYLVIR